MTKVMYGLIASAMLLGVLGIFLANRVEAPGEGLTPIEGEERFCTMDAMECPDGSFVGRTGDNCEFVCPVATDSVTENPLIRVDAPQPGEVITSPLQITGQARGMWYFEASFPVSLVNWDGLIIAQGIATAESNWMTEEFVPFTATLTFTSPYKSSDPSFMKRGTLILQKDNPSGLPENDDAYEIPVIYAPDAP